MPISYVKSPGLHAWNIDSAVESTSKEVLS
jgi:hypothetical protein